MKLSELKQENHSLRTAINAHQKTKEGLLETINGLRERNHKLEAAVEAVRLFTSSEDMRTWDFENNNVPKSYYAIVNALADLEDGDG